jgi:DNA polymerase-3 subunit alpha
LKTKYTVEFMTALLSASKNEAEKVAFYVVDCRSMGVDVLPPNVDNSLWDFSIEDRSDKPPAIRFGLGAIKNVGNSPVDLIVKARTDGPFRDLNDFARRVDLRTVGKRSLECLIRVGAMDRFGPRRALLEALDQFISVSASHFRAAQTGQLSFFGSIEGVEEEIILPQSNAIDQREQLEWERELLGLYVSDHPLTPYLPALQKKITHLSAQLGEAAHKEKVLVAGMVTRFRRIQTKKKDWMGFVTIEDIQGSIELVLFPRAWNEFGSLIEPDVVISAEGRVDAANGDPKVLVDKVKIETVESAPAETAKPAQLARSRGREDMESIYQEEQPLAHDRLTIAPPLHNTAEAADDRDEDGPPPPEYPDDWHLSQPPEMSLGKPASNGELSLAATPDFPAPVKEPPRLNEIPSSAAKREPVGQPVPYPQVTLLPSEPKLPVFVPVSYIMPPAAIGALARESDMPRMITVVLRSAGNKERDARRLKVVFGMMISSPGKDRFSLMVFEQNSRYILEFPNETTGISPELVRRLSAVVGEDNLRIEPIQIQ